MAETRLRSTWAVLRNALTWGAAWAAAGGAVVATLGLFDADPRIESLPERVGLAVAAGVMWGVRFGIIGAVIGTAFAAIVRVGYRGRRLADIDPVRFGMVGALVGGVGVPLFLQTMNVLSGGPIPWGLVTDDALWATLFGGAAAAGSILLARRTDALPGARRDDALAPAAALAALPAAELRESAPRETPLAQPARVAPR